MQEAGRVGRTQVTHLSYPDTLDLIKCDLEHEEDLAAEAEALLKRRRKLDVIVNNAGIMPEESAWSLAETIRKIGPESNGEFLDRDGEKGCISGKLSFSCSSSSSIAEHRGAGTGSRCEKMVSKGSHCLYSLAAAEIENEDDWWRRKERSDRTRRNRKRGPSEDYGNDEHTTVAAFLPWRGS